MSNDNIIKKVEEELICGENNGGGCGSKGWKLDSGAIQFGCDCGDTEEEEEIDEVEEKPKCNYCDSVSVIEWKAWSVWLCRRCAIHNNKHLKKIMNSYE